MTNSPGLHSSTPPILESDVLETAKRIVDATERYSVDTVDGEFYWSFCVPEAKSYFDEIRQMHADPARHSEISSAFIHLWRKYRLGADAAYRYIIEGTPIPVRPTTLSHTLAIEGTTETRITVDVRSAIYSGRDIANIVQREWIDCGFDYQDDWSFDLWMTGPGLSVRIAISLEQDEQDPVALSGGSFIRVQIGMPIPPLDIIASSYDAAVARLASKGFALSGAENGVNTLTAVRTWATALLIRPGTPFAVAQQKFSDATGILPVSAQSFLINRDKLLRRVPAAKLAFHQRGKKSPELATSLGSIRL